MRNSAFALDFSVYITGQTMHCGSEILGTMATDCLVLYVTNNTVVDQIITPSIALNLSAHCVNNPNITTCIPFYVANNTLVNETITPSVAAQLSIECLQSLGPQIPSSLFGSMALGYQFNWGLFGFLILQIYMYNRSGRHDPLALKTLVYVLFVLETLQTILTTYDCWRQVTFELVNGHTFSVGFLWFTIPIITGITSMAVQCFYAWRIRLLRGPIYLAGLIVAIALMQGSAAIAEGVEIKNNEKFTAWDAADARLSQLFQRNTSIVWLGGTAACDAIICASMVWLLSIQKTTFTSTKAIIKNLSILVIETGMATAIIAIITLGLFLKFGTNLQFYIVPAFVISKLYSNTLMVILLNRPSTAKTKQDFRLENARGSSARGIDMERSGNIQVTIHQEAYDDDLAMISLPTVTTGTKELDSSEEISRGGLHSMWTDKSSND